MNASKLMDLRPEIEQYKDRELKNGNYGEGRCLRCASPLSIYNPHSICNACKIALHGTMVTRDE